MYQFLASYSFTSFVVSVLASKVVRLAAYVHLLPSLPFILYLPSFLYLDTLIICLVRLLYRPQLRGVLSCITFSLALLLRFVACKDRNTFDSSFLTDTPSAALSQHLEPPHSLGSSSGRGLSWTGPMLRPLFPIRMPSRCCSVVAGGSRPRHCPYWH